MAPLDKPPLQTFTTFVEDDSGVLECIIGVFDEGNRRFLHPVATRVASGTFEKLSNDRLEEAIEIHQWARKHVELFKEARVVSDR
jgi:hypothetical protein